MAPSVALVVGHPGHELRVHHWMEVRRPLVFVLTDGGGHAAKPRIASTTRLLHAVGATPAGGAFYGALSDRELYAALLRADGARFVELAADLERRLVDSGCRTVAGDATEGYNPGHDVCRMIIDAAVDKARRRGHELRNLAFPLVAPPGVDADGGKAPAEVLRLDDDALARKLAAARDYPEMRDEVERALAAFGVAAFAREALWEAAALDPHDPVEPPFYERHGESRVREGHYRETVRWRDHVLPVARALREWSTA